MNIKINPQVIEPDGYWHSKQQGVILVKTKEDADKLFEFLCAQDDYWEPYRDVIKIAPTSVNNLSDIEGMCVYVGKTDIYNMEEIRSKVDFFNFQLK